MNLNKFFYGLRLRLAPFWDASAVVLLLVSIVPLALIDPAMVITLFQWTAYGLALAGITIIITRLLFPQINLKYWIQIIMDGSARSLPAALVVASVIWLTGFVFLGCVLWAKA